MLCSSAYASLKTYVTCNGHSSDDIREKWICLNNAFWDEIRRFHLAKCAVPPSLEDRECSFAILPARYNGLGLLSHYIIAPVARAAANEADDNVVNKIFQRFLESPEIVKGHS